MKKLIFAAAIALVGFMGIATAQEIPSLDRTGQPFRADLYSGKVLDPATSVPTTMDSVDFGFWTDYVRICTRVGSGTIYVRFATTGSTSTDAINTAPFMTAPASTSAAFIGGVSGSRQAARAITMTAPTSKASAPDAPFCQVHPWRTRGITIHVVSGLATADVSGFASQRQ